MPTDPNAFAEMVTLTIQRAMMPVLERVAGLEARMTQALAVEPTVQTLRDRVVVIETKAAMPLDLPAPPDLSSITGHLAKIEEHATGMVARIGQLEARVQETKAAPGPSPAEVELTVLQTMEPLRAALAAALERVAAVEARAGVPGPPGAPGKDGTDGTHGTDGADGIELDDLAIVQVDERTMVVKGTVGARTKDLGTLSFPCEIYRGVYVEGKTYTVGDCATFGGFGMALQRDDHREARRRFEKLDAEGEARPGRERRPGRRTDPRRVAGPRSLTCRRSSPSSKPSSISG